MPAVGKTMVRAAEMAEIVTSYRRCRASGMGVMDAYKEVGREVGRAPETIAGIMRRLQPTTEVAEVYLQSQALRLAARVVRKANVAEAIDVLSRSNMGVIAPKQEQTNGGGGFFLSVNAESCGAVKVGVMAAPAPLPQLGGGRLEPRVSLTLESEKVGQVPPVYGNDASENTTVEEEKPNAYVPQPQGRVRPLGALSPRQQQAIERARAKIKKAQRRTNRQNAQDGALKRRIERLAAEYGAGEEDGSVQESNGDAE